MVLKQFLLIFLSVIMISHSVLAQVRIEDEAPSTASPRKQLATIIFAGLGGSVLGLSTLSFYGRPQDNLSNIAIGFAVGVIGGAIYVTYSAAADPEKFYGRELEEEASYIPPQEKRFQGEHPEVQVSLLQFEF